MIDLHIHTTYSDGTDSVIEVLKKAQALKLSVISITDHERCTAYRELTNIDIKKYYTGKIITGIELKSIYNGNVVDILGYNFDVDKIQSIIDELYKDTSREKIQMSSLHDFYRYKDVYNLTLRPIDKLDWDPTKDWSSVVFYNELKSHPENEALLPKDLWESIEGFKKYYKLKGEMFYNDMSKYYPSIETITKAIHDAGGLSFIAHIHEYKFIDDHIKALEEIIKYTDGIEAYHSIFNDEQIEELLGFAKKHKIPVSGGSDYHAKNKPNINLGTGKGNLNIPEKIIQEWRV